MGGNKQLGWGSQWEWRRQPGILPGLVTGVVFVHPCEMHPSLASIRYAKGSIPGGGWDGKLLSSLGLLLPGATTEHTSVTHPCEATRHSPAQGTGLLASSSSAWLVADVTHVFTAETRPTFSSSAVSIAIARRHHHLSEPLW